MVVETASATAFERALSHDAAPRDCHLVFILSKTPFSTLQQEHPDITGGGDRSFIDCITRVATDAEEVSSDIVYNVSTPRKLSEITGHLSLLIDRIDAEHTYIVVESIAAFLTYNDATRVEQFIERLHGIAETFNSYLVLLDTGGNTKPVADTLYDIGDAFLTAEQPVATVLGVKNGRTIIALPKDISALLPWEEDDTITAALEDDQLILDR